MSDQIINGIIAVFIGLVLAVAGFVPFVMINYRRRGSMSFGRTITWIGSLIYFLALWTYTLMPFPDPSNMTCARHNLHLGQFISDIRQFDTSSLTALLHNPAVLQFVLNIILFLPLGFFARLLWRRGFLLTTVIGLGLSLFIETTQLTGTWGIYPCAYRVFDVDDLLANTTGALLGGILSWPAAQLVSFDNPVDPAKFPTTVSRGRRLLGGLCDWLLAIMSGLVATIGLRSIHIYLMGYAATDNSDSTQLTIASLVLPTVLALIPLLWRGQTPGDLAVMIRYQRPGQNGRPPLGWSLLRYLGGIGGYVWLTLAPFQLDSIFALVWLVVLFVTRDRRGLPGVVSRLVPVILRPGVVSEPSPPAPGIG